MVELIGSLIRLDLHVDHSILEYDLSYLQVACDEIASEVRRLTRDNDFLLLCLNLVD